ncbi:hypothetical protein ACLKA6_013962 [Drosophila palustris]
MLLFKNLQKGNLLTDFETDDDDDDEDEEENENEQRATEVNTHALNVRQESRQSQTANVCDNWSSNTVEEAEVVKRKTPPSTEELEKRFNALEKQRSTTHIEANEDKREASSSRAEEKKKTPEQESTNNAKEKEEKSQKLMKAFDDKVKSISATLTVEEHVNEVKAEVVEEKCQAVKQNLLASEQPKEIEEASPSKTELHSEQSQPKELSKRRASEPPSMEDLNKRYERLKRRMSNKNHFSAQSKTVNEALERIEQEVIAELGDATDEQEQKPIKKNHPQQKIWKVDTRRCTARRKRWKVRWRVDSQRPRQTTTCAEYLKHWIPVDNEDSDAFGTNAV